MSSSSRSQARDPVPPLTPASRTRSRRLAQESPKAPLTTSVVQDSPTRNLRSTRANDYPEPIEPERSNGVNIREEGLAISRSRRVASPQRQSRLIVSIPLSDPPKREREPDDQEGDETGQKHRRLLDGSKKNSKEQEAPVMEGNQSPVEPMESSKPPRSGKDGVSTRSTSRNSTQRHQAVHQEKIDSQKLEEQDPPVLGTDIKLEDMETVHPAHLEPPQDTAADEVGDMDHADRDRSEPPSQDEGDEEPFEKVPEYIKREMQEFEQGFNGLEGKFKLLDKIGEGTFSSVYKAVDLEHDSYSNSHWDYGMDEQPRPPSQADKPNKEPAEEKKNIAETGKVVAIKRIYVTSSPKRIENEIRILHELSGHKNVVPLITAFRYRDQVIVVLPYFEHKDFRSYYRTLPMDDIRCYLRALLKALAHVHSHKIIHRDVKPSNFLYDLEKRTGVLVDFGLAHKQKDSSSTTMATTPRSGATVPKSTSSGAAVLVTTAGADAGATASGSSAVATVEQQGVKHAKGQSNKENIEPSPPKKKTESAPTAGLTQPSAHTGQTAVLGEEGQTGSGQPSRQRTVFVPNTTTTQALQAIPASQTPNLVNHVRPSPSTALPSTSPSAAVIPQTSITATNREPGFLKKDNRPSLRVNRAGTRGFRAPEILFRHVRQTVALDIWSVGVILISILTGRFPFFNSADDAEAILEIGVLFGNREMKSVAAKFNRSFDTNVPSIKELPISLLRIVRLLYPKRFGPPDGYVSKSQSSKPRPQGRPERQPSATGSRPPHQSSTSSSRPPPQPSTSSSRPPHQPSASSSRPLPPPQPSVSVQGSATVMSPPERADGVSPKSSQHPHRQQKLKRPLDIDPSLVTKETEIAESEQQVPLRKVLESLPINDDPEQIPLKVEKTKDTANMEQAVLKTDKIKDINSSGHTLLKTDMSKDATSPEQTRVKVDRTKDTISSSQTLAKSDKTKDTASNETRDTKAIHKPAKVLKRIVGWDSQEELEVAVSLLERLLALDPKERITAEEALRHPFLATTNNP
ncbi:cell division control protein 7 [Entomortierella parvispora]|uniref:non-specific serine/threonine protein kinase n=1 Tax=Entomortierella parvispora TaxID=205924 RepID=A0A9P3H5C9_9FUNG|nr:cell division control protein 7 [Entomortierella parvispora]